MSEMELLPTMEDTGEITDWDSPELAYLEEELTRKENGNERI